MRNNEIRCKQNGFPRWREAILFSICRKQKYSRRPIPFQVHTGLREIRIYIVSAQAWALAVGR